MDKVLVIHGPNLNMLGTREPSIYGNLSFNQLNEKLKLLAKELKLEIEIYQSNHEGYLIDKIQESASDISGILINPGAYSHTSIALRDALTSIHLPIVEVHISNIHKREEFRHFSYISAIANAVIVGFGIDSYLFGLKGLAQLIAQQSSLVDERV